MKVAAIQHDIVWRDGAATRDLLRPLIAQAATGGARLVVLSEMFATGFSMDTEHVAEPVGGPNEQFLIEQARSHGIWTLGSIAQRADEESRAVNVAVLAGPDGQRHRYTKIHPFSYGGENKHYQAGSDFLTVTVEGLRVSVFICYDLRFADEFWKLATDTDLYVVPANWPASRGEHWRSLLKARAIENLAFVVGCNRIGMVDDQEYVGDSVILDPLGRALVQASRTETILMADLDPAVVAKVRQRYGFLLDRR